MKIKRIVAGMIENNIYIVNDKNGDCFIVDPGVGEEEIIAYISKNNLCPKGILLTHGHYDHIGRVNEILAKFDIPVFVGSEDIELLENPQIVGPRNIKPVKKHTVVKDEEVLEIGEMKIKVISTPGHTKGGVCYLVEGEMFTGDSIFRENIGRCDLYGGNYHTMLKSVAKVSTTDCNIYPGHGESSTMAHERMFNPYFPNNR